MPYKYFNGKRYKLQNRANERVARGIANHMRKKWGVYVRVVPLTLKEQREIKPTMWTPYRPPITHAVYTRDKPKRGRK